MFSRLFKLSKEIPFFIQHLLFCVSAISILSFLKLKSASYESLIFKNGISYESMENMTPLLFFRFLYYVIEFVFNLSIHWITSSFYSILLREVLLEYFNLKIINFCKIGFGTIQCTILRRVNSFCEFLDSFMIKILPRFVLFSVIFVRIFQSVDSKSKMTSVSSLTLGITMIVGLHYLRSLLRFYVNKAYEESNDKRIDILESYERIVSYCCLEDELMRYYQILGKYTFLRCIYVCSYYLIGFVSEILLLGLSIILLNGTTDCESFVSVILLTEKLKETIYSILQEIEVVFIDYSNYNYTNYKHSDVENDLDGIPLATFENEIKVVNMSVKINSQKVLDNVNFTIKKGSKTVITGLNGSGKSLLMGVIFGIVDYQGSVKIDGIEVKDIRRRSLVENMSYVTQNTKIFNTTIRNNLLVGRSDSDDCQMIRVSDAFGCHDLFKKIGYDKVVGDRGKMISGGQRQRIILLRGILREKSILLVDSAFTGLDQQSEEMFVKTFRSMDEKTVICSTQNHHMFSYFDQIIFISNGIVMKDNYANLLKKSLEFRNFSRLRNLNKINLGRIAKYIGLNIIKNRG